MPKKKAADPSLKGKKPINTSRRKDVKLHNNPGHIKNKLKRSEMYGKYLQQKQKLKQEQRQKRAKEVEELGDEAPAKVVPKTLDNSRTLDPTMVRNDPDVTMDEETDEFAPYFNGQPPKVLITTRPRPSQNLFYFIADLQQLIPELHFYPRKSYSIKEICQFAAKRDFTHLLVLSEKAKQCNGLTLSHLRKHDDTCLAGPTAFFKVSNIVSSKKIPNHGASTSHLSELNFHGFETRLGHRVGRLLASLFPHNPDLKGRQVVTFHNQRDYLFVRHHRYIFDELKKEAAIKAAETDPTKPPVKARLQELGPRFTLKMRWLQEGTFDTKYGEYEWIHKRKEMDTTRRTFHL